MEICSCLETLPYKDNFILRILIIVSPQQVTTYLLTYTFNITLYGHFYSVQTEFSISLCMHIQLYSHRAVVRGRAEGAFFCPHFIELESLEERTEIEICVQSIMLRPPDLET